MVVYIPEAGFNILSWSQMNKAGMSTRFDNVHCLFIDRQDRKGVIADGVLSKYEGFYTLDGRVHYEK